MNCILCWLGSSQGGRGGFFMFISRVLLITLEIGELYISAYRTKSMLFRLFFMNPQNKCIEINQDFYSVAWKEKKQIVVEEVHEIWLLFTYDDNWQYSTKLHLEFSTIFLLFLYDSTRNFREAACNHLFIEIIILIIYTEIGYISFVLSQKKKSRISISAYYYSSVSWLEQYMLFLWTWINSLIILTFNNFQNYYLNNDIS